MTKGKSLNGTYIFFPLPRRERTKVRVDNRGAKPPYKPPKRQTAYGVKKRQEKKTEGEKAPRGKASLGIRGKEFPLIVSTIGEN